MHDIKPCPKCGADDGILCVTDLTATHTNVYRVRCFACGHKRKWSATPTEARGQWNRARRNTRPRGDRRSLCRMTDR